MTSILIIGRHAEILATVIRLLNNQPGWQASGAQTDNEAIALFSIHSFDIVLIGGGVEEQSEEKLTNEFKKLKPAVKIVRHFGGGSGLLYAEIMEALSKQNLRGGG